MQNEHPNRRDFIKSGSIAGLSLAMAGTATSQSHELTGNALPRWRGFNMQYFYQLYRGIEEPREDHFKWISGWGFDFVRVPMDYRTWLQNKPQRGEKRTIDDVYKIDESTLEQIDKVVEYGDKHGIHVNLCFHRCPGFKTGGYSDEPFILWKDQEAVDALAFHWELFAKRYKGVAKDKISFNLFNEAPKFDDNFNGAIYHKAIAPAVKAIKNTSPDRIIIADGALAGKIYIPELIPLGIHQSVHCYVPGSISHYKVDWMQNIENWPEPQWPGAIDFDGYPWGREKLALYFSPWKDLMKQGVGVHMGETSGSNRLPQPIFLAWLRDVLEVFKDMNVGYALWDFIGKSKFGILDTERSDVDYEDWYGHKLDRKMLKMLQEIG